MHEVAHVDIRIDRDSGTPAYRQIYQQIRHQIAAGSIPAGALIPKIRDLAASLGVVRDTVEAAYRQLSLEGYAHGKRGIGYVVEDPDFSVLSSQPPEQDPAPASVGLSARRKSPLGDSLGCRYDFPYGKRDYLKIPTNLLKTFAVEALDQEMMHLFMSSPEWARYERTTVNSYRRRHDALIASIHEYLGDKVRIVDADAGLHILLGDGEKRDQSELINLARVHDVRVYGTNRYWVGNARPMRNFVLVGFSQIREEDIPEGIRRLGEAWYG